VAAAAASGYVNAGTVEFLLAPDGAFYFLEVNTRLQVEHPITEMITGIDMVREQIKIAAGRPLALAQGDITGRGHALECRIYGEDPENDFFPCAGGITYLKEPSGPGIRTDTGIYSGFEVPVEYDPILSKLIAWAATREEAIERMVRGLREYVILGIRTPIPFLIDVLGSDAFLAGETFTDFLDRHFRDWAPGKGESHAACVAYILDELTRDARTTSPAPSADTPSSPWQTLGHWRL
jgi:acetyl/propionyl-CoA carboxylase alpha subunit